MGPICRPETRAAVYELLLPNIAQEWRKVVTFFIFFVVLLSSSPPAPFLFFLILPLLRPILLLFFLVSFFSLSHVFIQLFPARPSPCNPFFPFYSFSSFSFCRIHLLLLVLLSLLLETCLICWINVYSHLMTHDRATKICTPVEIRKRMAWILVLIAAQLAKATHWQCSGFCVRVQAECDLKLCLLIHTEQRTFIKLNY